MKRFQRHGLTRIDVLGGLVCIVAALAMSAIVFAQGGRGNPNVHAKTLKDAKQQEQIHQAMLIFARESEGTFPRPGLINRLADPDLGRHIPGRGPEDVSANTTANLYSCMIAQNYFTPELVVSPVERNPNVSAKANENGYDYDAYNPVDDSYWDSDFKADLKTKSHVSFAHPPLVDPHVDRWLDEMRPNYAQLGNRGPTDGTLDPDSYTCGPHGNWAGNIVFGDNHFEFLNSTTPASLKVDNLFAVDKERKLDSLLAFTKSIVAGKAELQFD